MRLSLLTIIVGLLIIVATIESKSLKKPLEEPETILEKDDEEVTTILPVVGVGFTDFPSVVSGEDRSLDGEATMTWPILGEGFTNFPIEPRDLTKPLDGGATAMSPIPGEGFTNFPPEVPDGTRSPNGEATAISPIPGESFTDFPVVVPDVTIPLDGEATVTWAMPVETFTDFTVDAEESTTFRPIGTRGTTIGETTRMPVTTDNTTPEMSFITSINSSLTTSNPTFQRPFTSTGSYYYDLFEISATGGFYIFETKSSMDTVGFMYYLSFDEALASVWHSWDDDHGGQDQFRIDSYLYAGPPYYLVVTTFGSEVIGDYQLIAKGTSSFTINRITEQTQSMPNVTIVSSLSFFHPQFTRPDAFWTTFYEVYRLTVSTTDDYIIQCRSSFANYIFLYHFTFNASSPSSNLITSEGGYSSSGIQHNLELTEQYYLVITSYYLRTTGNFSLVVKGPEIPVLTKLTNTTLSTRGINGIIRRTRRFQRPGGAYPSYFYSVYQVVARRSGYYVFSSNSSADLLGYLYQSNFYAGQPQDLLVNDTDSGNNGSFPFMAYLASPRTYYFVVTTVERRVTTHFRLSVSGVINALLLPVNSTILTNATVSSEWTTASGIFRRPNGFGRNHYYQVFEVTVSGKGLYSLICGSAVDSVGYIYHDAFNASSPNRNLLTYDDQHGANDVFGGNDQFGLTLILESNVTYYLVATTYREFRFGPFDIIVQGEGQAAISAVTGDRRRKKRGVK